MSTEEEICDEIDFGDIQIVYHGSGDEISHGNDGDGQSNNITEPGGGSTSSEHESSGVENECGPLGQNPNQDSAGKTRERRSKVWEHFTEIKYAGKIFAKCNYCTTKYTISEKSHGSTGNMQKHLTTNHKKYYNNNDAAPEPTGQVQAEITSFLPHGAVFCKNKFRSELTKWVVVTDQPHIEVEKETFRNLLQSANPALPISTFQISGDTVKHDIMCAYQKEKLKIAPLLLAVPGKISFTHDGWTSLNQFAFMGIKSHWISSDWKPVQLLIDFPNLVGSHTGLNIFNAFSNTIEDYGITSKLFVTTTDNATNNDTFFEELDTMCVANGIPFSESKNRVRCGHILNLVVQDILTHLKVPPKTQNETDEESTDSLEIEEKLLSDRNSFAESKVVIKLRKLVRMVRASPQRREKLSDACKLNNVKNNQVIIDVKTRWNSTYCMIARALQLKVPIF